MRVKIVDRTDLGEFKQALEEALNDIERERALTDTMVAPLIMHHGMTMPGLRNTVPDEAARFYEVIIYDLIPYHSSGGGPKGRLNSY